MVRFSLVGLLEQEFGEYQFNSSRYDFTLDGNTLSMYQSGMLVHSVYHGDLETEKAFVSAWLAFGFPNMLLKVNGKKTAPEFFHDYVLFKTNLSIPNVLESYYTQGLGNIYFVDTNGSLKMWVPVGSKAKGDWVFKIDWGYNEIEARKIIEYVCQHLIGDVSKGVMEPLFNTTEKVAGQMFYQDCVQGSLKNTVTETAEWLRVVLPRYRITVPSVQDVKTKLKLEKNQREVGKSSAPRPLSLTLQAVDTPDEPFTNLWFIGEKVDQLQYSWLLVWDAVLYAVAASAKMATEHKPALFSSGLFSDMAYIKESRFSKKQDNITTVPVFYLNPERLAGPWETVAMKLITLASRQLTRSYFGDLSASDQLFQQKLEYVLLQSSDLISDVSILLEKTKPAFVLNRNVVYPSIDRDQWFFDNVVINHNWNTVDSLIQKWGSVRSLTDNASRKDILELVDIYNERGLVYYYEPESLVRSMLL